MHTKSYMQAEEKPRVLASECGISWSSISAGVLTAALVGLLFNLLGVSIGFSMFNPTSDALKSLSIGSIIWLLISGVISLYAGGWVAGRFGNTRTKDADVVNGVIVSAVLALLSLVLMVSAAGSMFSNSVSLLGNVLSITKTLGGESASMMGEGLKKFSKLSPELTNQVKRAMPDLIPVVKEINQKAQDLFPKKSTGLEGNAREVTPEKIKEKLEDLIKVYLNSDAKAEEEAKSKLVNFLVEATGKSSEEINREINDWSQLYREAKVKAYQEMADVARKAAKIVSEITLINFFILMSTIVAAVVGSINGASSVPNRRFA